MGDPLILEISVFVLAVLIGQLALSPRARAIRWPFIAAGAAVSSVISVAALVAAGTPASGIASGLGFVALVLSVAVGVAGFSIAARLLRGSGRPGD